MNEMKPEQIAACGMNCRLCLAYKRAKKPCPGCRSKDLPDAISCRRCVIKNCPTIQHNTSGFCYECDKFPCLRLKALDKRYRGKYHMSMLENLQNIKTNGLTVFLEQQIKRWTCPQCGSIVSAHRPLCLLCHADYPKTEYLK